jgi:stress-induced morphogen
MSRAQRIQDLLTRELSPLHLELIDETTQHNAPPDGESHFRLLAVSDHFAGLKPLARHRLINGLLGKRICYRPPCPGDAYLDTGGMVPSGVARPPPRLPAWVAVKIKLSIYHIIIGEF